MSDEPRWSDEPVLVEAAVADADADGSVRGDTPDVSDAEQAAIGQLAAPWGIRSPTVSEAGDTTDGQRRSSRWNKEPEVGNCGFMFGNWGTRQEDNSNKSSQAGSRRMHENADRQILKSPAHVIGLAETTATIERILQQPAVAGDQNAEEGTVDRRPTCQYHCFRGNEPSSVLIACRTDTCKGMKCVLFDVNDDRAYTVGKKPKMARTRTMVAEIYFKQNIGHMGTTIVYAVVHLHCKTARQWPAVADEFWDIFASRINIHGIQLFAGDFNMSLTQVIDRLRSRGILCDCIAWYPYRITKSKKQKPDIGHDSCGIFYVGGNVSVRLDPPIEELLTADATAVADNIGAGIDIYEDPVYPGQHWSCYQPKQRTCPEHLKCLTQRSTPLETLNGIPKREGSYYCPYIRFNQKKLNKDEWLMEGKMHGGSHYPIVAFTHNASHRSEQRAKERAQERLDKKGMGKGQAGKVAGKRDT